MRYGCCLNMVARQPDRTGAEYLEDLCRAGFDYVELPLAEMMALDDAGREQIKNKLQTYGIACEVCNNFSPTDMRLTGEEAELEAALEYVEKALSYAKSLGAVRVVFGSGKAKQVPDGFDMQEGYRQVVALLKEAGRIAGENGIVIAIEPLRRQECNLINTFEEGCQLAGDVGSENVKVLVDYYHLTEEQEPLEHLERLGAEYLQHVHFADPEGRVYPTAGRAGNFRMFADALKKIGYDQRISCEAYTDNYTQSAGEALRVMRQVFEERREHMEYEQEFITELEKKAQTLRRDVVVSIGVGVAGHLGGSCSAADIVAALYFYKMKYDPKNPKMENRDRFLLSKGHVAILQYAALAEAGFFPVEDLKTTKDIGSYLQGHPDVLKTPGIEAGTGSLGQGLSIGLGMALGLRLDQSESNVYVILGDGENQEGQVWEAAMAAAAYHTDHLVAIVDKNGLQANGKIVQRMNEGNLEEKWKSFGWHVIEIDGHDMRQIVAALDEADEIHGQPTVIIANTVKGKGVSFAENVVGFHNGTLTEETYAQALQELS